IETITHYLRNTPISRYSTVIVLRLIFIRYLIDRGVNFNYLGFNGRRDEDRELLGDTVANREELYSLFAYLNNRFNGGLFVVSQEEYELMSAEVLHQLSAFISGRVDLKQGQTNLFDVYDFNILPIEL